MYLNNLFELNWFPIRFYKMPSRLSSVNDSSDFPVSLRFLSNTLFIRQYVEHAGNAL